jgi:hypothetical protein
MDLRCVAWEHGKQTLLHIQSEKSTVQGCVMIKMFKVMTSVIVYFCESTVP